jgi:hypothetical protein
MVPLLFDDTITAGIYSNFLLDNNFTIAVTQNISNLPINNEGITNTSGVLAIYPDGSGISSALSSWREVNNTGLVVDYYNNDNSSHGEYYQSSSKVIDIKIQRVGDVIFESYADHGSNVFTPVFYAAGSELLDNVGVSLQMYAQSAGPVENASVTYSNFSASYGDNSGMATAPGGSVDNPALLTGNAIDGIVGTLGDLTTESFFGFHWDGGQFLAVSNLLDADPESAFEFQLFGGLSGSDLLGMITLDASNNFTGDIAFDNLLAGDYRIGLSTGGAPDPTFYIAFAQSVSGIASTEPTPGSVPEPATWATMLAGFGLVGATMRRRKRVAMRLA